MQITLNNALNQLDINQFQLFAKVMEHGSMSVEIYRPQKADLQQPHRQDERYVVMSGNGEFVNDSIRHDFGSGRRAFCTRGH